MIKKIREFLKNKGLVQDVFNLVIGILMMVALIAYSITRSVTSIYLVIFFGALMNLTSGLKLCRQKTKRNLGMSMILLGAIILFILLYLIVQ